MNKVAMKTKNLNRAHHLIERTGSSGGKLQASVEPFQTATDRKSSPAKDSALDEWNDSYTDLPLASQRGSLPQLILDPHHPLGPEPRPVMSSSVLESPVPHSSTAHHYTPISITGSGIPIHSSPASRQPSALVSLQSQLKVQTDINRELKRLLVASVGSDLEHRLQQMAQERAELSRDLDFSLQQVMSNSEELDQVVIECDIWRSKFIASRVMLDELASWKAELSLELRESHRALKHILKEREDICRELTECRGHLHRALWELKKMGGVAKSHEPKPNSVGNARVAAVSPFQYSSGTGVETLPKVTMLDLARKNQSVAKELCSMVCAFTEHHQDRRHESDTKFNIIPDDKPGTIEFTAGEKLAQRIIKSKPESSRAQEASPNLPKLLVTDQDLLHHRLSIGSNLSPLSRRLFHFGARALQDPFRIPFQCRQCKGKIVVV